MKFPGRTGGTRQRLGVLLTTASLMLSGCRASEPVLSFLDEESNVSFTHPPRWSVGFADQGGVRYRYLTAPKVENEKDPLSITLISPTPAASAETVAQAYLTGATSVAATTVATGVTEWSFKDSSGVASRLRIASTTDGRYFGAWARASETAMKYYQSRLDTLLGSLQVEDASRWPEERFSGMVARAPQTWTRGSRLSSPTNATMQFKSLALDVDKGTFTIHGFVTVSKQPVPPPGDLEAFNKAVKDRAADTVVMLEHKPWPVVAGVDRSLGYADLMRSGTTLTSTRVRRWIAVKNGVGLTFLCEARADAFDRLDPWCRRMAATVGFE